ncbi:putative bifunctional diguanylate cyclase/phosphodiesterase [Rhizobium oryzicola]|uniref:EAL domain-containing protein n=1 Tax=Rhizobium oryzicola TaxID=1232668 RepID=A0ABT8STJ3_9HYPH|nr:bifunctional diguanylate cyclase/phosphodiesterase [Rhizobium oryzicola]MDO1581754.1 EAL domain-containing protein [Rhizobium oryzicola]
MMNPLPLRREPISSEAPHNATTCAKGILDQLQLAVWIFDIDQGRVVWANAKALEIWAAASLEELCARNMAADMSPAVERRLRQYQADFVASAATFTEMWTLYPKGTPRPMRVRFSGVQLSDGRMGMLCEGSEELGLQPETIRSADALLHTQLMISMHDVSGRTLYSNPSARGSFAENYVDFSSRFVRRSDFRRLLKALEAEGEVSHIVKVRTSHGSRWHEITARACRDPVSGVPSILVSETDVSELKEAEAVASSQAHHDPLTGLPNRLALRSLFERLAERNERSGRGLALLFIDLDQFKAINDTLGHDQGDALLMEVSRRLLCLKEAGDAVVRLGGDEFLFLASTRKKSPKRIERLAGQILKSLAAPVEGACRPMNVTPSIGIALYPDHARDIHSLMRYADLAMYSVKANGRNQFRFYDDGLRSQREHELEMISDLREALRSDQFVVFYQPRYSVQENRIVGVEALIRWRHPEHGLVAPGHFIPVAESSGLIGQIGEYVLREALRQNAEWRKQGIELEMSVNVSLRQLRSPDFPRLVSKILRQYGCPPASLELELTETALFEDDAVIHANLKALRTEGVRIAIDDFGTGYSNLARLSEVSVDCIKLDRSLIQDFARNRPILRMVIAMCKFMEVTIVAEGVETRDMAAWTAEHGCHELQGYYFSKPVPACEILPLLDQTFSTAADQMSATYVI